MFIYKIYVINFRSTLFGVLFALKVNLKPIFNWFFIYFLVLQGKKCPKEGTGQHVK